MITLSHLPIVENRLTLVMTILSRLRSRLSAQAAVGLYLGRAIAEISLIVIGILIAIQLDNYNEQRQEKEIERRYIVNLIEDLHFDIEYLDGWFNRFPKKMAGLEVARDYYHSGDPDAVDAQTLLPAIGIGGAGSRGGLLPHSAVFQELVSSGSIRLIQNDEIKSLILDYFAYKRFTETYAGNLRSEYASYVNGSLPYSPVETLTHKDIDVSIALRRYREPEFLALIHQEATFAHALNYSFELTVTDATALIQKLQDYLDTF